VDHHSYEGGAGMKKSQYTRQKLTGNYFITPNIVFDLHLHAYELVIYAYLLRIEDRKIYECLTSYSKIAKKLGLSINTVAKYVRRLEEHGLIETEHTDIITQDGLKRNGCLRYHILPIQYAVDLHHKQRIAELEHTVAVQKARKKTEKLGVEYVAPDSGQSA